MSNTVLTPTVDPLLELHHYTAEFDRWLNRAPAALLDATAPLPDLARRVDAMTSLMQVLFDEGWSRYGWPADLGGLGGTILHRAAMWAALARCGVGGMAMYEHLEVLAPTLVAMGPSEFIADALPNFLRGDACWAQGFSEPDAGSDLATVRTRATSVDDGFLVSGRKIWTSWAHYARWCLALVRTGSVESRHRGLTALIIDLDAPGVEVTPIEQANGTDELAEVVFEDVHVPAGRVVGDLHGGWAVAMHILSHERGTFAWFRHCFLHQHLADQVGSASAAYDRELGNAVLDLAAVNATSRAALEAHSAGNYLGPRAAFTKLLLCVAERSVNDWVLASDPAVAFGTEGSAAVRRQDYLFSRIVSVYGGSEQMQLETISKQILRLP